MKLPQNDLSSLAKNERLQRQLAEFDRWITPSIQEIQDTEKYRSELVKVDSLITKLGLSTSNFSSANSCNPDEIATTCIGLIEQKIAFATDENQKNEIAVDIIESLCSLLFMVTGKSDNNLKCQFPVYLIQSDYSLDFPQIKKQSGKVTFPNKTLGRTIKSEKLAKLIADILVNKNKVSTSEELESNARWLLGKYVTAILKDESSINQFWTLGRSYFYLKEFSPGSEKSLLAPIVIFKIRGSVSASGGHIPEDILRGYMDQWGMERGVDYNTDDVILDNIIVNDVSKTRAYDFVLPYKTDGWFPEIFIQCQFYAGDSGSVSHKVVDQTQSSRPATLQKYPDAKFIEYLDGAGYYASLNKDLQHMLGMETTKEFIQVRTAHVKLRREFQEIGYLIPIEIEHTILKSKTRSVDEVKQFLVADGYSVTEVDRVLANSLDRDLIEYNEGTLEIIDSRLAFARQLLLIDLSARIGVKVERYEECSGVALVPGYDDLYGAQLEDISVEIDKVAPSINYSRTEFARDIQYLAEKKFIILR